ncbi:MAG: KpsF/GutQ family sugar-phosphate isomerase [Candidatus Endonucleobacter bathymodioli]|uniref:Arabinose 5-phosphate isomerase n=1 Tax=Candidatus Endonucleibacter bathymodioli TaxID=539814 RepID=A0AA90NSQ5_9GAMM|nr:KpsF/GutQ family sugar-phosphate isomerase [Candidatus Endonucleobacter bathymodioli]
MTSDETFILSALQTLSVELEAIHNLKSRIDNNFAQACRLIFECRGRMIVTGMGKSGHIARKIASTFSSTGTPAYFVHPGEACHGDMGMITNEDVILALSNSGETCEVVTLLPLLKRMGVPLISMTGAVGSTLAEAATVNLNTSVKQEACPLGLAPTSSTTTQLVMGDALAISILTARGFTAEDFAFSHPGGALGRKLLLRVKDVMHIGSRIPAVKEGTLLSDALHEVTQKGLGITAICSDDRRVVGVFTDGDLRRALGEGVHPADTIINEVMTPRCTTISPDILAAEALKIMDDRKISVLICVDDEGRVVGAINMHDLLKAGVI